ncbi:MAG: lipocalin family protein, partial [Pseudomonadota bacterium]|nr:lipocalin family protein [Pseudomonadota bacterium]
MFKQLVSMFMAGMVCVCLSGCTGVPDKVVPVEGFELPRYLGKWYEIARFDHSFEEGLSEVTATYSMRDDGGVKVINRGFSVEENAWDEAEGKAYFVESETTGHLKVS